MKPKYYLLVVILPLTAWMYVWITVLLPERTVYWAVLGAVGIALSYDQNEAK